MTSSITRHIPNLFTCLNLASGCLAVVYIFKGEIPVFALLIVACLIFDFLDGFLARSLNAYSDMGKQLDSLADMVSFGFVPGAIMYHLFLSSVPIVLLQDELWARALAFFPFIITVFSALRLAKFNIDTRQTHHFIGLPTPAATIFVLGLAMILYDDRFHLTPTLLNSYFLAGISMVLSYLLVSDMPLFSLKFNSFKWHSNKDQYLLLILSIVSLIVFGAAGLSLIIILYIILSAINHFTHRKGESTTSQNP